MFFTLYFRQTTKIKLKRTFETVRKCLFNPFQPNSETKPSLLQTSKMESFAILVHGFQPIKARPQMSKKRCLEKYYSCDKALPEGVILEKPTIGDKYNEFDLLYIKLCAFKRIEKKKFSGRNSKEI